MDVAQLRRGNLFLAVFLTVYTCANWHGHDLFFLLLDSVLTFRHTPALVGRMSAKISES
ncbi:hypothetical protein T4E_11806 [Trichinella pseudospiralis]|uniref:Uncharacterized protein n=1 Tax=Trichinella pseudospiralis TaxID=6337 RepID=A0A0V0Y9B8_TRIPS|nr:hypothetical protein T4E_11806 [Trichinella pseudospiralis]